MSVERRICSAPAAEDELVTRLRARPSLTDTLVRHGLPPEVPVETDRVYVVGVENLTRTRQTQQGGRRERYILPLVIESHSTGGQSDATAESSRLEARARVWEIIDELEQELHDDPELGLADDSGVNTIQEVNTLPVADGWMCRAIVHVLVEAIV